MQSVSHVKTLQRISGLLVNTTTQHKIKNYIYIHNSMT